MENTWLAHAKRLQALAATGLHYSRDPFDIERFEEIDDIARDMIARLADTPVERLSGLPEPQEGYATPKIDIRAAVIRNDRILLVREKRDGKWTMPGGFADIGLTASDCAVKETWEEATLPVRVLKLYELRHRAKQPGAPDYRDFYKFFFLCEADDATEPAPGPETSGAAFYLPDALPEMSLGRSGPQDVDRAFVHWRDRDRPTDWD
ncbi:ADP-ribose pyrophosphatase YjhB (NUDIX family) [Aliiruegeria haliotis]|uniref:ADP-ribose pyrophosphatase YjhB (NUDIX family) n=1 Tax=Aliiruegeria haliotis TaxID=1280846 RepID=A0A2T0RGK9_9RHOB|nr:NUDIX hydrolase N-terminal domain-containing protein [Aliiruegeria haliotis]PRY20261.1 ADP-ribose pyrophosphatase YjhB (NUDIX family) [Aliiruegeria haliotis]